MAVGHSPEARGKRREQCCCSGGRSEAVAGKAEQSKRRNRAGYRKTEWKRSRAETESFSWLGPFLGGNSKSEPKLHLLSAPNSFACEKTELRAPG
ncbi:hypothetical protein EJB05_25673, partial [Eragrostis curvula]